MLNLFNVNAIFETPWFFEEKEANPIKVRSLSQINIKKVFLALKKMKTGTRLDIESATSLSKSTVCLCIK